MVVSVNNNDSSQTPKVKHAEVHHGALEAASTVAGKDKNKVKKESLVQEKTTAKKSKKQKLRPNRDIGNKTYRSARGSKGGPSLFSVWSGDALSLFMFNVSPLIMQLNFKLRETLSQAQKAEAVSQITSANASAVATRQAGEAEATKMNNEASSSFANAAMGLVGMGQSAGEMMGTNGIMEDELATQDKMLSDMATTKPPADEDGTAGHGILDRDATGRPLRNEDGYFVDAQGRTAEDIEACKAKARSAAKKFKHAQERQENAVRAEENSSGIKAKVKRGVKSAKDWFGSSKYFGAEKSAEQVSNERNIEYSREASKRAHEAVKYDRDFYDTMDGIRDNPEAAKAFMEEMGAPDAALNSLRGMGSAERGELLRGFAKTDEGQSFKAQLNEIRMHKTKSQADFEKNMLNAGIQKRQILTQMVGGFASGASQVQGAEQTIEKANADASARILDANANVMGSVRGSQDGAISGALENVKGLAQWYDQMESQVIGAVSQSLA